MSKKHPKLTPLGACVELLLELEGGYEVLLYLESRGVDPVDGSRAKVLPMPEFDRKTRRATMVMEYNKMIVQWSEDVRLGYDAYLLTSLGLQALNYYRRFSFSVDQQVSRVLMG